LRTDYFGNTQYYFSILKPHKVLQVIATSIVTVFPPKVLVANIICAEALHLFSTKLVLKNELLQFQLQVPLFFLNEIKLLHKLGSQ
jgi:hypothetical protein